MGTADHTRDLIVTRAMALFNTKGYRATSLSDITKATGMTKGAIYGHFINKEEVAEAGFDYAVRKVTDTASLAIRAASTAPDKLRAIADYYSDYVLNPPIEGGCPILNTAVEADDDHPHLRAKVERFISVMRESLQKIIHRGIREGQIKPNVNVEETAVLFYAAIEGAIMMSRVEGDNQTFKILQRRLHREIDEITI
ncbi:MAG: TetR/AcrR family transcriptional regulator [Bacteroidota bacterium]